MAPKRTTRSTRVPPVTPTPNEPTTTVTEAQLQALIDQGVAATMAKAEASRVRNGLAIEMAPRELSDLLDGLRKWSLCLALAIAQQLVKSNLQLVPVKKMLLHGGNAHVKTTTPEAAHAMTWAALKKMMTDNSAQKGESRR
ncbi:hypothetical protein Tco_1104768 [Tanacetum coccineum]